VVADPEGVGYGGEGGFTAPMLGKKLVSTR
jgi:hypothetical protein